MISEDQFSRFASTTGVREGLRAKSVRGALFTAVCGVLDFALRLGSTLVLARLLIPEHFGLLGMVIAVTGIAEQFSSLGLSTATIQTPEITHRQCSNLFWINVVAGGVFGLTVCVAAPLISVFYQDARLVAITLAISTNFLWGGLTVQHEALLNRQMKQGQIAGNRLVASLLSTCVAIGLALADQGYWALVWREITRSFLVAIGVWLLCRWRPGKPTRGTEIGRLLRFGRDMTLTELLIAIISRLDSVLIGKYSGASVLGLYRQAYYLVMLPVEQLNRPIRNVSQPGLSVLQADPERYRRYYQQILFVVTLTTIPLGVFTAIYAREIVLVVLGQQWMGAVVFLQIFGVAAAIRPAVGTSGIVLVTCGHSGRFLLVAVVHSVTLGILMVGGVPWGAQGVAVAHVSTTVLLMIPKLYYSFAGTPVTMGDFFQAVFRPIIAGSAMALALAALRCVVPLDSAVICVLVGCATAAVVYFAALALLPGGWRQLNTLAHDVLTAMRRRSPVAGRIGNRSTGLSAEPGVHEI